MNIHKNVRTTPRSRGQIVERVLTRQEAPAAVAAAVAPAPAALDRGGDRPGPAAQRLDGRPPPAAPRPGPLAVARAPGPRPTVSVGAARRPAASRRQKARPDRARRPPHHRRSPRPGAGPRLGVRAPRTNGKAERFIQTLARVGLPPRLSHVAPPRRGAARLVVLLQLGAPAWRAPRSSAHHLLGGPEQSPGSPHLMSLVDYSYSHVRD
jgi:hypothetical protein